VGGNLLGRGYEDDSFFIKRMIKKEGIANIVKNVPKVN